MWHSQTILKEILTPIIFYFINHMKKLLTICVLDSKENNYSKEYEV